MLTPTADAVVESLPARQADPAVEPRAVRVLRIVDSVGADGRVEGRGRLWVESLLSAQPRYAVTGCVLAASSAVVAQLRWLGARIAVPGPGPGDPRLVGALARTVRTVGAEVIHVQGAWSTAFGTLAAQLTGRPVLLERIRRCAAGAYTARLQLLVGRRASTHPSATLRARLSIVPAALRQAWSRPISTEAVCGWRARAGIPLGAHVVGSLDADPRAAARVAEAVYLLPTPYDTHLIVLGRHLGRGASVLRRRLAELALTVRTHLIDAAQDDPLPLAAMDVAVCPSARDPSMVLRALALGRPLIAGPAVAASGVIAPGRTAWSAAGDSPRGLARAIDRLLVDVALSQRLGREAAGELQTRDVAGYTRHLERWYDHATEGTV
jgi:hypothetical protein